MATFTTKRNDTFPIKATLEDADGPVDLTGATVKFLMQDLQGNQVVDASATITNASQGKVEYNWVSGDVDTAGEFEAEFEVTFSSGKVRTFPNEDYITVVIEEDKG